MEFQRTGANVRILFQKSKLLVLRLDNLDDCGKVAMFAGRLADWQTCGLVDLSSRLFADGQTGLLADELICR